ncbi:MAG: prolipoprotein diacylglyceryl transferase [Campylobacteraceae bacterium]|nr:prolipoprotein diacylglyceryl transferase [Campylobacteraceae bacterium]
MLATLAVIKWDVAPEIFTIFGHPIRWYSLLFAATFFVGLHLMQWIYKKEGKVLVSMVKITQLIPLLNKGLEDKAKEIEKVLLNIINISL